MKNILNRAYINAEQLNDKNVFQAVKDFGPHPNFLDVGCWDGEKTVKMGKLAKSVELMGIELIDKAAELARSQNITTFALHADQDIWPIDDNSLDCVVSNQVVEHLSNLDHYFSESARVLKKGGYLITSTNNLSSLHNIGSLFFGFAPFDLTNSSSKIGGIGNPFAVHKDESDNRGSSWTHKCVYTTKWLSDWQKLYGFEYIKVYGSGLYPFPAIVGKYIPLYSAFITLVCKKIS